MGAVTFILGLTAAAALQYVLFPVAYTVDLFLLAALYISLRSSGRWAVFTVWGLGLMRGAFSSPGMLYPIYFIGLFILAGLVRDRIRTTHPFTQFVVVFTAAMPYYLLDIVFSLDQALAHRLFLHWGTILVLALLNALAAMLVFRILARLLFRIAAPVERRSF